MKFAVVNLGCKVNRVEADSLTAQLCAKGATETTPDAADYVVVNTCTVTGEAEKKTRKAVRAVLRSNTQAQVVVTGCASAINPEEFLRLDKRVQVIDKFGLGDYFDSLLPSESGQPEPNTLTEGKRTRVGVKIQDGCNHACTYCIVHVARGKSRSIPVSQVVQECVSKAQAGVPEIVLTGINLGSYSNTDGCGKRIGLAGLIELLLAATAPYRLESGMPCRFRISSIEPMDVDECLIECMVRNQGRVCWHLHLPLQSGSSRVLQEMHRPYSAEEYKNLVANLYASMPSLSLSTDIIVGFPGESEQDFNETLLLARSCRFSKIHVFPYSRREGTPAAIRADQVPADVITKRAKQLRELASALRREGLQGRKGTHEWAVVEDAGRIMTDSYYELPAPDGTHPGQLVRVLL